MKLNIKRNLLAYLSLRGDNQPKSIFLANLSWVITDHECKSSFNNPWVSRLPQKFT